MNEWINALARWIHVAAGITWIGHLYFFNYVNAPVQKALDGETKKKLVPELMPRALYFFRWGAMYTWVSGIILLALIYYHENYITEGFGARALPVAVTAVVILFGFFAYDFLWKSPLVKNPVVGAAVSFALVIALAAGLTHVVHVSGRGVYITVGALFGTIMFMNVWMRIWPSQRKIIAAVRDGQAPDAALVALAGLRSRHNTYMSVPLVFTMVSNHYGTIIGFRNTLGWVLLIPVIALGWAGAWWLYKKSASAAPARF